MRAKSKKSAPLPTQVWSAKIASGGRVVLPAKARAALGLEDGDPIRIHLEAGQLHIVPLSEIVRDIQARWRHYIPEDRSLVDELIADRRAEAKNG